MLVTSIFLLSVFDFLRRSYGGQSIGLDLAVPSSAPFGEPKNICKTFLALSDLLSHEKIMNFLSKKSDSFIRITSYFYHSYVHK